MEGHSMTPTLTPKVMEEAEKAWSLKPKEYEPPVDQNEKERRARFRVSRGQIHHYNKDSRRLDFWIWKFSKPWSVKLKSKYILALLFRNKIRNTGCKFGIVGVEVGVYFPGKVLMLYEKVTDVSIGLWHTVMVAMEIIATGKMWHNITPFHLFVNFNFSNLDNLDHSISLISRSRR